MANGPAGRKFCTARERCGFWCRTVVTMPTLAVLPAHNADTGRLAQARGATVRRHQQWRAQHAAVREHDRDAVLVGGVTGGGGTTHEHNTGSPRSAFQDRCVQSLVLDDVGRRLASLHGVVVGDEHGAEGIVESGVGDVDRRHGLGMVRERSPDAERRQQALGARRDGRGAHVAVEPARCRTPCGRQRRSLSPDPGHRPARRRA